MNAIKNKKNSLVVIFFTFPGYWAACLIWQGSRGEKKPSDTLRSFRNAARYSLLLYQLVDPGSAASTRFQDRPPPEGPDSFVLTYNVFRNKRSCIGSRSPYEVGASPTGNPGSPTSIDRNSISCMCFVKLSIFFVISASYFQCHVNLLSVSTPMARTLALYRCNMSD